MAAKVVLFGHNASIDSPDSTLDVRRCRVNLRRQHTREYQRRSDEINRTVCGDYSGELEMLCSINNDDPAIPLPGSALSATLDVGAMTPAYEIKLTLVSTEWATNMAAPLSEQRLVLRYHFNADTEAEILTDT